jgi:hypothetical protein
MEMENLQEDLQPNQLKQFTDLEPCNLLGWVLDVHVKTPESNPYDFQVLGGDFPTPNPVCQFAVTVCEDCLQIHDDVLCRRETRAFGAK